MQFMTNTNFTLETQQLVVDRNFGENCFFAWELDQKFDDSYMSVYIYECEATAWYWLSINTREVQELLILIVALIFKRPLFQSIQKSVLWILGVLCVEWKSFICKVLFLHFSFYMYCVTV